jgi:hypothetical protein
MTTKELNRDFDKATVRGLVAKGIRIVGKQAVPGRSGTFLDSETAYLLDDNGTGRLKLYLEVMAIAGTR